MQSNSWKTFVSVTYGKFLASSQSRPKRSACLEPPCEDEETEETLQVSVRSDLQRNAVDQNAIDLVVYHWQDAKIFSFKLPSDIDNFTSHFFKSIIYRHDFTYV